MDLQNPLQGSPRCPYEQNNEVLDGGSFMPNMLCSSGLCLLAIWHNPATGPLYLTGCDTGAALSAYQESEAVCVSAAILCTGQLETLHWLRNEPRSIQFADDAIAATL
jgi:hypothetical protein